MKSLKGWNRFNHIKAKLIPQIVSAKTDSRLQSLAKRVFILETAIRKMNNKNGAFLDAPAIQLKTIEQMKNFKNKQQGIK